MLLPNQSIVLETAFSLQHLHRIIQALKSNTGGGWDPGIIQGVICWIAQRDDVQLVKLAWERARSRVRRSFCKLVWFRHLRGPSRNCH
jgi:hypothetical protein